jgi:hypothetical protein
MLERGNTLRQRLADRGIAFTVTDRDMVMTPLPRHLPHRRADVLAPRRKRSPAVTD